ncbi:hypothetical protein Tco_1298096 [Tanacetum coccineum]
MADDEHHPKPDPLPPNTLIAWESFQLPSFPSQFPLLLSPDPNTPLIKRSTSLPEHNNSHTSIVFPPTNHEGLNCHHHVQDEKVKDKVKPELTVKPVVNVGPGDVKWWFLRWKLLEVVRGGLRLIWGHKLPFFGVILFVYLRFRRSRRRRVRRQGVDELVGVIKEKDERIQQLLYQIARMNELLLASHHGVPIRSKAASV